MTVILPERLVERVEEYARERPDATLAETLGHFRLDPDEESDERALVESVLDSAQDRSAPRDAADETGGARA